MTKHFEIIESKLESLREVTVRVKREDLLELMLASELRGYRMAGGQRPCQYFEQLCRSTDEEIFPVFIKKDKLVLYGLGYETVYNYCRDCGESVGFYDATKSLSTTEII